MNLPERRVEQQRSPAEPESNITELRPADRATRVTIDNRASLFTPAEVQTRPDPAFWTELNATIDEFFAVIGQSRTYIAELSSELIKRDAMISVLEAQNVALKARLGIADSAPTPRNPESRLPELSSGQPPATDRRNDRSIWDKLTNLERGGA